MKSTLTLLVGLWLTSATLLQAATIAWDGAIAGFDIFGERNSFPALTLL